MWVKINRGQHKEEIHGRGAATVKHSPDHKPVFRLSLEDYNRFGGEQRFQVIGLSNNKPEPDEDGEYPDINIDPETGEPMGEI